MRASGAPVAASGPPSWPATDPVVASRRSRESRRYLRGSSLLVSGRALSLLLNLAVQALIVRSLSKGEYGAFAYGLGAASIASSVVLLGLDKTVSRFIAVYQERGDERRALGTVVLSVGIVLALGLGVVVAAFALRDGPLGGLVHDPRALSLLLILIVLAPIDALDALFGSVSAVLIGARAVFVRRHLLRPGLKLAAVLVVLATSGDVFTLGYAYVVGSLLGMGLHLAILVRVVRARAGGAPLRPQPLALPVREVIGYSLPLLASEILVLATGSLAVVLLEYFRDAAAIAEFRSVLPIARLNLVVLQSFSPLYIPLVARMHARADKEGINDAYWRTATWLAVLSFPIFVLTFALAEPVTVLLFGATYATSGPLLAVMAVGFYVNAALGFNSYTLRVCGPVRYLVAIDLTAVVLGLGSTILLIQRLGALGAALGITITVLLQNGLTHVTLGAVDTGVRLLDWRFLRIYALIAMLAVALVLAQQALAPPIAVSVLLAGVASVALLYLSRDRLDVAQNFPEVLRVPLLRRLLAAPGEPAAAGADEADPLAASLAAALRERAVRYPRGTAAPAAPAAPAAQVRLVAADRRRVSRLYTFDVTVGEWRERLVAKVPIVDAELARAPAAPGADRDRPRVASVPDPATKAELEHAALQAIHAHFARLGDPALGAVPVFDYLPDQRAVVMQCVPEPSLRTLVMRAGGVTPTGAVPELRAAFGNLGRWLRHFHALPVQPHVRHRHADRAAFVAHVSQVADFLGRSLHDAPTFGRIARDVEVAARSALPDVLPLGRAHGDFAMRNVLVGPGGRVTVLDTLGRFSTAIYEDLGYLLADLRCNPVHGVGWLTRLGRRRIECYAEAFLAGYFGRDPVPTRAIALYEVQAILDRWASVTVARDRAAAVRPGVVRTAQLAVVARLCRGLVDERLRRSRSSTVDGGRRS